MSKLKTQIKREGDSSKTKDKAALELSKQSEQGRHQEIARKGDKKGHLDAKQAIISDKKEKKRIKKERQKAKQVVDKEKQVKVAEELSQAKLDLINEKLEKSKVYMRIKNFDVMKN